MVALAPQFAALALLCSVALAAPQPRPLPQAHTHHVRSLANGRTVQSYNPEPVFEVGCSRRGCSTRTDHHGCRPSGRVLRIRWASVPTSAPLASPSSAQGSATTSSHSRAHPKLTPFPTFMFRNPLCVASQARSAISATTGHSSCLLSRYCSCIAYRTTYPLQTLWQTLRSRAAMLSLGVTAS